jgi:hypothetical protein
MQTRAEFRRRHLRQREPRVCAQRTYLPVATVIENFKNGVRVCPDHDCLPAAREGRSALDIEVPPDPAAVCKYVRARVVKPATLTS